MPTGDRRNKQKVIIMTRCYYSDNKGRFLDNRQRHLQKTYIINLFHPNKSGVSSKASIKNGHY